MAASKSYYARTSNRFLPTEQSLLNESMIFELDESEVWNSTAVAQSPEVRKSSSRVSRKASARGVRAAPSSLPVNVPDWSKILKNEYRENRHGGWYEEEEEEEEEDLAVVGNRIPPHEFLARQMAATRIASASVHEGIGRTLKGRDLSRVRNAIWQKTGFED
ncbi:uncharacterized protein LOC127253906 [Andrographis paniculata]|uniref:uncharacterized protein LOC127253906 n=1 Tax=Andrographis paniculata TaxID=175694 RepID=UPI0021E96690|nr:uncharacterized protein LOC127253906 [Andrographis paniculata]